MRLIPQPKNCDDLFLPDLCALHMVFVVVIIAELAAFVIALAPLDTPITQRWESLGMISLYVQWCALGSCTVLCIVRPWLCGMSNIRAGIISYVLILLVIIGVTELAYWLVYRVGYEYSLNWHWQFLARNVAIGALISGPILRYFYVQNQWRRKVQAESEARLQALQSRIRPHFLFNSMNTIASLVHAEPEQAEAAVENLADLFRASLSDARARIPLEEELALCRHYLEIEALRLGDRLQQQWRVEVLPADALVPPLLLQPLLENAVYHGIEPLTDGGTIEIDGNLQDGVIEIRIRNPLNSQSTRSQGNRIALDNIRQRLAALYGKQGNLHVDSDEHHYTTTIRFPFQTTAHEDSDR
ncbi:MAG: histidine kinase [Proteobacteria bacterium]|jgi:two-component system sensor histidine kinase AlgZ|nr:histidine kinase [Pseudomonadota bacterium]